MVYFNGRNLSITDKYGFKLGCVEFSLFFQETVHGLLMHTQEHNCLLILITAKYNDIHVCLFHTLLLQSGVYIMLPLLFMKQNK